jgi:post-segregation antitoxin (ccd killing protein)
MKKTARIALRVEQEILDALDKEGLDVSEFFREAVRKQLKKKRCPTCSKPL